MTTEGPKYYIVRGHKEEALRVIHRIYATGDDPEYAEEIYEQIEQTCQRETSTVTLKGSLTEK